jgi:biotin transport system substrate-specific component
MYASISRPLVDRILPERGLARHAAVVGMALLGTAILWASAKISVPFYPVPMTLQTFAVMALAAGYGLRLGLATILLYMAEGAIGLPLFTGTPQQGVGIAYMLGPTGGYLLGFVIATALIGWLAERGFARSPLRLFGAMLLGDAVVFALGLLWLGSVIGWDKPLLELGLYPFLLGDFLKIGLAAALVSMTGRLVRR